jgi:hypothetical protein
VEEDEGGDDERVDGDFFVLNVFVEQSAGVEAEVAAAGESEAANDERDDSEEHQEAEDIGEEIVSCADRVDGRNGEWEVAFERVDEVDETVEDEAVEDEGVKEADGGALFEGALLGERGDERVPDAAREIVEAGFGVGGAAADAEIEAVKAFEAKRKRDERKEKESDLLG